MVNNIALDVVQGKGGQERYVGISHLVVDVYLSLMVRELNAFWGLVVTGKGLGEFEAKIGLCSQAIEI